MAREERPPGAKGSRGGNFLGDQTKLVLDSHVGTHQGHPKTKRKEQKATTKRGPTKKRGAEPNNKVSRDILSWNPT